MELEVLIQAARADDVGAFTELTRRYQNMAFGYAFSLLQDFHLAEDATQEAFIAVYFDLRKLGKPEAFPGWLRSIVRNQCHRILRRLHFGMVSVEHAREVETKAPGPDHQLEHKEMQKWVRAAIDALPEEQREIITLFYIEEYAQQEIAEFLDVPVSTTNNRLHAARARLKSCPYAKGGTVGLFGDMRVGKLVLIEEIVRRLAQHQRGICLFTFVQGPEVSLVQDVAKKEPRHRGGTLGAVQTFYLLSENATNPEYASALTFLSRRGATRSLY